MKKNTTRFYKIDLKNHPSAYELQELIKEFLRPSDFYILNGQFANRESSEDGPENSEMVLLEIPDREMGRDDAKRYLFNLLRDLTGYAPKWGTLTGVRPAKLVNEQMYLKGKSEEEVRALFRDSYYVSEEKIDLVMETCRVQSPVTAEPAGNTVGVYIGIPFCPTRCLYCSFTSNQKDYSEVKRYLAALHREIDAVGTRLTGLGVLPESIYFGGGTPTTPEAPDLDALLARTESRFDLSGLKEYCVEAGRPDTITADRLRVLRKHPVTRISINPQSMNDETLERIGRTHRSADIREAFALTKREAPDLLVNSDIIAGLPGEDRAMFRHTLESLLELGPDNITVHTLAVKRASRLREMDAEYNYGRTDEVGLMVGDARRMLAEAGYRPYYMYRQKHMTGNYENVSYAKPGTESIYNIRIMDEHQTIAALGAGGISKAYHGAENRLVRVPNVSNYEIYIQRIEEMIERKEQKLYVPFE